MDSPIQGLIELIMSNAWILVIIIGFIFNTFRRFKGGESEPTTQIPLPKQYNPFDQETKQEKEVFQETKYDSSTVDREEATGTQPSNPFYERYLELQQEGTYSEIKETETKESEVEEPVLTVTKPTSSTRTKAAKSFSKNKVVEGIIWSEILGPPRAKKPYQTRR